MSSTRVGTFTAYLRLTSHGIERLTSRAVTSLLDDHPWPEQANTQVTLTVFEDAGRLFVGAVEVRTQPEPIHLPHPWDQIIPAPDVEPDAVDTAVWRAIPLGTLSREALAFMRTDDAYIEARDELTPGALTRLGEAIQNLEQEQPKRGPRSTYTPKVLEVAARAFLTGGTRGVVAARDALEESGLLGPIVTHEQAKKAIAKARQQGILPPAGGRRKDT